MNPAKFWEKRAEKIPGLGYVVTGLSLLVALELNQPQERFNPWLITAIWVGSVILYQISGFLDGILFDPFYSVEDPEANFLKNAFRKAGRVMCLMWGPARKLDETRTAAAHKLKDAVCLSGKSEKGIYQSAKTIFKQSEKWEGLVKLWLDLSKAARAFIIPLFLILIYDLYCDRVSAEPNVLSEFYSLEWLADWFVALILFLVALLLYIRLRIAHMRRLYKLILDADVFAFQIRGVAVANHAPPQEKEQVMLCVGSVVLPSEVLKIIKPD